MCQFPIRIFQNICLSLFCLLPALAFPQKPEDKYLQNKTVTHKEAIAFYASLDKKYPQAKLLQYGETDCGRPLHLFVISTDKDFNPSSLKKKNKRILMVNNAIHPGEPDGVDASINLSKDLLENKNGLDANLKNTVLCIIPLYNIGGALNRNCCTRVNQDGPEEYGFRGSARNLDLNRDFIKCDSKNAKVFTQIFREWDPDVFIDTHVTNGADYQYVMTVIATQKDKLHPKIGEFLNEKMVPELDQKMKQKNYPFCPYVNTVKETPDSGLIGFLETPRYSTGYAALYNCFGFVSESHMLKPFPERVKATYAFILSTLEMTEEQGEKIAKLRAEARQEVINQQEFPIRWLLDTVQNDWFNFRGYEARYKESNVTGLQRLYYDTLSPFERIIKFYNSYNPEVVVSKPKFYIVPQAWTEAIERLKLNKVEMERLSKDTVISAEFYFIESYKSPERPYEGHFLHSNIKVRKEVMSVQFFQGDYIIATNQESNRYIIETLEPEAHDSFFAWNFFDEILQQKEWFSSYVFEEIAEKLLLENPTLKKTFEAKKSEDKDFANNTFAQLYYIYKNSPHYEKNHLRYPVARILSNVSLPVIKNK
jgi:hypothetical protein